MRLTDPRERILRGFVTRPLLSQAQIYDLCAARSDAERRNVRARVLELFRHKAIRRQRLFHADSFYGEASAVHWQYQYSLSERGVAFVREKGLDPGGLAYASETRSPWQLRHEAELADCDAALLAAFPDARIWRSKADLRHAFQYDGRRYVVDPDRLYYFSGYCYFLELERGGAGSYRGGESQRVRKLRNYLRYARCRAFKAKHLGMADFYLLTVVGSAVRRDNLLAALGNQQLASGRFLTAAIEDCRRDFGGAIWHSPREGRVCLPTA